MGLTYREAGVDIDAGNELVQRIKDAAKRTHRPELLGGIGGFAALASLPEKYQEPLLVTGTDGVGTKLALAVTHNMHDGVGQDLVAMCVNDVLAVGAEAFLFLDYFASSKLDLDVAERVINGIARGCEIAGCALVGGETAEMPGFYQGHDYDLAGFCVGVVERSEVVTGDSVAPEDVLIGVTSSGPHANGFSLIRRVMADFGPLNDDLLNQLMAPTRIYMPSVLPIVSLVTGLSHITGGGLIENIPRMFSSTLVADIDLGAWVRPRIFDWIQQQGGIDELEMLRTFNCGIGFVIACRPENVDQILEQLTDDAVVIGRIESLGAHVQKGHLVIGLANVELG
ncbi:MAG TPA: phosphoribosylformylglycinamidine cyclo-ligase [Pseudomonadales bacterium]|nr:phosphoribosylformylglycinamidine cyclo-ligase [Gammaproteobacteria bacterium]HIM35043.1 phosphoribosylformylglycinamidine cyclo-ligase [Pseudomonadales bacterium]